jgi:hypothetical protein
VIIWWRLALRLHWNVAGRTTEVRTVLGLDGLKAFWKNMYGWRGRIVSLGQACHAALPATRALELFVPLSMPDLKTGRGQFQIDPLTQTAHPS